MTSLSVYGLTLNEFLNGLSGESKAHVTKCVIGDENEEGTLFILNRKLSKSEQQAVYDAFQFNVYNRNIGDISIGIPVNEEKTIVHVPKDYRPAVVTNFGNLRMLAFGVSMAAWFFVYLLKRANEQQYDLLN